MDRPKREEIAYILLAYDKDVKLFMSGSCTEHPSITESIDQVLALFPDEETIQREERERKHKRHKVCSICYRIGVADSADYLKNTYDQPTMANEILRELH